MPIGIPRDAVRRKHYFARDRKAMMEILKQVQDDESYSAIN